jgi:hypothetical protein
MSVAQAEAATILSVAGYIDAVTGNRVFGWAWDREQPDARIAIRVRHKGEVIATIAADRPREDLVANRVGDGAHAFEITLADGISPREVVIEAVCPSSGAALPLTPKDGSGSAPETKLMLEAVVRSQRHLARQVAAVADRLPESEGGNSSTADIVGRLNALETSINRIDRSLSILASGGSSTQGSRASGDRALLLAAVGLGVLSLVLGAANLLL